jgi:alginate O-acetyltransferase complex protein AlgI
MLFNSLPFLVFIVLFFALWPFMQKRNTSKWLWICVMSFLFYGWWDWRFLFLLLGTGTVDYMAGYLILRDAARKKLWLWLSLSANIASLFIFKYSEWLAALCDQVLAGFNIQSHFQASIPEFTLVLPVGISFYTFNSMSYTIDLYRGKAQPAKNLLHFFAFISFFPHLVAGPIIRARDILGQLSADKKADAVEILHGIKTCIWGFFQKMVIADNLAVFVNEQFNDVQAINGSFSWWICMLAFTFQIYFDFNGYSTIARGIAKLCGIHFRLNFNHPYLATSFRDFWQRWHISLSSFFRDYVYIPLGGSRKGRFRSMVNTWFTMILSGLWHGANLTFIVWGALHALYLSLERLLKPRLPEAVRSLRFTGWLIVFPCVLIAWVFFRAASLDDAWFILKHMLAFNSESDVKGILTGNIAIWLAMACALEFSAVFRFRMGNIKNLLVQVLFWSLVVAMIIYLRGPEQQFIYFQF